MLPDDVFRSRLEATVAALRYWVPTVSDAAAVTETAGEGYWKLAVRPFVATACPFDLMLRADQHYDITIAGEAFEDQPIESLEAFVPLITAIADGRVVQRLRIAEASGRPLSIETIVKLPDGRLWSASRSLASATSAREPETLLKDRHFLPYRR
jgi:hypothetical protein